jgi:hypothetical protein
MQLQELAHRTTTLCDTSGALDPHGLAACRVFGFLRLKRSGVATQAWLTAFG